MNLARLLIAVAAALLLVGCGAGPAHVSSSSYTSGKVAGSGSASAIAPPGAQAVVPGTDTRPPLDLSGPEGPRVQRSARIGLQVKQGSFDSSLDRLLQLVQAEGGFVSGSTADTDGGHLRQGTVNFQVPEAKFQDAIDGIRRLGTVQHLNIGGNDVTFQYIDLQARLKNAQAQRDAMLAILAQAKTTGEIIQVQTQLGQIQGQIEQLQGQINYLDHSTNYSTVSVALGEIAPTAAAVDDWGLRTALAASLHQFVASINAVIVALGAAGPFLLLALLAGFIVWRFRPRAGRVAA